MLVESCREDPEQPQRIKGQQYYYLQPSIYNPKIGITLSYSDDAELFGHIAYNCTEVYSGKDTILFGNVKFLGSNDTSYYFLYTAKYTEKVKLNKADFIIRKQTLEKITLP